MNITDWEFDSSFPNLKAAYSRPAWSIISYYSEEKGLITEEVSGMRCRVMHRFLDTLNGQPLSSKNKLNLMHLEERKSINFSDQSPPNPSAEDLLSDDESEHTSLHHHHQRAMKAEDILESWFGSRKLDINLMTADRLQSAVGGFDNDD